MHNPFKDFSHVNPQREDGRREIENSVFQALMRAGFSGAEYQVIFCVIHKTWGFNKKEDVIPLSQFTEATGIDKRNIAHYLERLEKRHVILIQRSGPGRSKGNTYMLNKHWDTWVMDNAGPKGVPYTPIEEMVLPVHQLALNGVASTPLEEKVSQEHQSGTKGVQVTPLEKGVQATPISAGNGVNSTGKGVDHAQRKGVPATPSKERSKEKDQKKDIYIKERRGSFGNVLLTADDYQKLAGRFGTDGANDKIEALSLYIKSKGAERKYKEHYATLLAWDRRDIKEKEKGAGYGRRESGAEGRGPGTHREDPLKTTRERGWETDEGGESGA